MIENILGVDSDYNNAVSSKGWHYTFVDFEGVQNLVCYRTLPFSFSLSSTKNAIGSRDIRVFYTENVSRQGAKEAITVLRDYAMSHVEAWTSAQEKKVEGTQTFFIVYNSETDMKLYFSKEVLTIEQLQEQNEGAEIWVSYNISDIGLIRLVNELIDWL